MNTILAPNELLARYRAIIDEREALAARDSLLSAMKESIERDLLEFAESSGLSSFEDDAIRVTVADKMRVRYDPERWTDILKWDIENGIGAVQRRLTDAKIISLVEEGTALPEGLTLEGYKKVSHRRK